jgi:hypothetical protein
MTHTVADEQELIKSTLAKCEVEFTPDGGPSPDYDANLAELCRSALRGNAVHAQWVLGAHHGA